VVDANHRKRISALGRYYFDLFEYSDP